MSAMDSGTLGTIIALLLLIGCSAFFSASETAYTCLNRVRLKNRAQEGDRRAERVLALAEQYDRLISTILIGNNLVNILSASLATALFVRLLGNRGITISTAVMTVAILLFGEVAPKTIARAASESIAERFYPLLFALVQLFTPLTFLLGCGQKLIGRLVEKEDDGVTEDELLTLVDEAESVGGIDEHESELIRSAIEFNDLSAEDILTPRVDISAIPDDATPEEAARAFQESGYSRMPVYHEEIDQIIGVLHEKDFFREGQTKPIQALMQKPPYVTRTTRLSDLLRLFQRSKNHMAVVMDEYGGVSGIVTLEDVLEELVGEIWDEHDDIVEDFVDLGDGQWRVQSGVSMADFEERFPIEYEGDAVTVGGWVLEKLGRFPEEGESFETDGMTIVVEKVQNKRVMQILVRTAAKESASPAED